MDRESDAARIRERTGAEEASAHAAAPPGGWLRRQNAALDGMARILRETLGAETEEELCRTCLAVAQDVTGSAIGFVGELDRRTGRLNALAISDQGWEACRMPGPPRRGLPSFEIRGLYGRVLREGRSLLANDPASHPDRIGTPSGHPPLTSFLGVPLHRNGAIVGMVALANRPGGYDPEDLEAAECLAPAIFQALERKRAEEARRESEEWFRLLFESTSDGVWIHSLDGVIREVNDAYCAMCGYTRAELEGAPISTLEATEGPAELAARVQKLLDHGGHDRFETRHRRKDGSVFDVDVTALHLVRGGEERIAIFTRDITARKQAVTFAEALNAIGQVIHSTRDLDGILRSALIEATTALGATTAAISMREGDHWVLRHVHGLAEELVGATMRDDEEPHAVLAAQRREPVAVSDTSRDPRVNGPRLAAFDIRSVLVVPLVVRDAPLGVCFFNWQGTAVELGPAHVDFAVKLGSAMSLAIENARLLADLREADRRKDDFLAMLSHELRNPLAPIRNSVFVLERARPGAEEALRAREVLRRQTEHLTRLVDELLDVTRISRGKIQLHRRRVDLRELVQRACDDHRALFQRRAMGLTVALADGIWVDADETRVVQIVGNLLQNAARFGGDGGTVRVDVARVGGEASIRVRDDGIGIAPEFLPRMFEPFVQAEHGLARGTGGLGLGLALVKGLVELHGGAVSARSEGAGRGAEFQVTLPLATVPPAQAAAAAGSTAAVATTRILVVDDNPDEAVTLRDALELLGHEVAVAHDGAEGLERARAFRPDVVLCDIGLPRMSGFEVARAMRADPALAAARLIALTGYARPEDVRATREAGFDEHVPKPASISALEEAMRRAPAAAAPLPCPSPRGAGRGEPISALACGAEPVISSLAPGARTAPAAGAARPAPGGEDERAARARALEAFLSRAAHDLRAPLRHIEGFCDALVEDCGAALGGAGERHVARIRLARARAQALVEDVLALWRVTNAEVAVEAVDLTALAREICGALRQRDPARRVDVAIEEGLTASADGPLLRVVLENLLGNAWKFTAQRGAAHVTFGRATTASGAAFFVRDDGPGFDEAHAGKLFEPFQRLHALTEFEGTGLGLYLVRRVAERHGGRAWIETRSGEGTTAWFTLGPAPVAG